MDPYKEELIARMTEIKGRIPANTIEILNVLIHPEVLPLAKAYLQEHDKSNACQKHIAPWNCIEESEVRLSQLDDGWLGGERGTGLSTANDMCEPCQEKLWGKVIFPGERYDDEVKLALNILRDGDPVLRQWKPREWENDDDLEEKNDTQAN